MDFENKILLICAANACFNILNYTSIKDHICGPDEKIEMIDFFGKVSLVLIFLIYIYNT